MSLGTRNELEREGTPTVKRRQSAPGPGRDELGSCEILQKSPLGSNTAYILDVIFP